MKHRQSPQVDRAAVEPEGDRIADRIQKSAAMVGDHALGIAGRPGGVIERDRIPFVLRPGPGCRGIALGKEGFVFRSAERGAADFVVDFHERDRFRQRCQRLIDDR